MEIKKISIALPIMKFITSKKSEKNSISIYKH